MKGHKAVCVCKCIHVSYKVYTHEALYELTGTIVGRADWVCLELRWGVRQEHKPYCLDLLCLSACFVTMQYRGGGTETSGALSSCFWDSLASGSIWVFDAEQHCFHCGPEENCRTKKSICQVLSLCAIYKHSCISPSFSFRASNCVGTHMIDYSYSKGETWMFKDYVLAFVILLKGFSHCCFCDSEVQ